MIACGEDGVQMRSMDLLGLGLGKKVVVGGLILYCYEVHNGSKTRFGRLFS